MKTLVGADLKEGRVVMADYVYGSDEAGTAPTGDADKDADGADDPSEDDE